jgi:hypothetical protein
MEYPATLESAVNSYFRHWLGGRWLGMLPFEPESLLSGWDLPALSV